MTDWVFSSWLLPFDIFVHEDKFCLYIIQIRSQYSSLVLYSRVCAYFYLLKLNKLECCTMPFPERKRAKNKRYYSDHQGHLKHSHKQRYAANREATIASS